MSIEAEERRGRISSDDAWDCARGLVFGMPVCVGFLAVGAWAQRQGAVSGLSPGWQILLGLLPLHVGLTGSAVVALGQQRGGRSWRTLLALDAGGRGWQSDAGLAFRFLAWVYPACLVLSLLAIGVLTLLGRQPGGQPVLDLLLAERHVALLCLTVIVILIAVPFVEELLFRRLLHDALTLVDGRAAAPLTALTFALIHGVPEQTPALFLLGLVLQDLRTRTGSLWAGVWLHAGFNASGLLLLAGARAAGLLP